MAEDRKTILIVEDDPLNMRLTVDLLQINGFNTLTCSDGVATLDALKNTIPDLILLDINMPKINGYEVYKKIKDYLFA